MSRRLLSVLLCLFVLAGMLVSAWQKTGLASQEETSVKLSGGTRIQYAVVLPENLEPGRKYPAILAFPGGRQGMGLVRADLHNIWRAEAERRGYVVVSPSAVRRRLMRQGVRRWLYFDRGARYFPEFLDRMIELYPIDPDQVHIGGVSNGGISAFHIASLMPGRFRTVVTLPGFVRRGNAKKYMALLPLCIIMFAGENDRNWVLSLNRDQKIFKALGKTIFSEILPDGGHLPRALMGPGSARLYDLIESGAGC